jgi:hypothetical protein
MFHTVDKSKISQAYYLMSEAEEMCIRRNFTMCTLHQGDEIKE